MSTIWATENYFDDTIVNSITTASEDATYPIDNAFRFKRRGLVYRTSGNYVIESGSETIAFKDVAGPAKYAVMDPGEYSEANFLLEIKEALEDASSDTFTVTMNASNKITIASSGSYFQLLCTDVSFTALDLLGFDGGADLTGALTYTSDFVRIHTSEWVKVDFGIPINPETFICIGKRNSVLKFSEEATLTLQGNSFDSWDTPEYEATIPWNENVLYLAEPTGLHTGPLRYWRFYVEDRENFNGYIEVSNLFFGKSWVPDRGCPQFGLSYQQQDLSVTVYSESGVSLTDLKPQTSSIGFDFKFMTKEDEEELRYIFEVYGTAKAFFLILDPEEVIVTNPQDLIKYVKFVQEPSIIFERPNVFSASITLREEL